MYKKRAGTSGIRGQLYETKLISLILFRAQHDDNIQEFYMASNMDDIGAFDDICFKAKIKGSSRPLLAFIQAKHRENNKCITLNNKNDLVKYFQSYSKIKQKFERNSQEKIFGEEYNDIDCVFIMYTTEKSTISNSPMDPAFANHLNGLIATGHSGFQPIYTEEYIQGLSKLTIKEEINILAKRFAKFLNHKTVVTMMNDDYILRYHVILARSVVDVSEVNSGYRNIKFRSEFFDSTEEYLVVFRNILYLEVLKNQNLEENAVNNSISLFLSDPSENTLSHVIGSVIIYKNDKFEFVKDMSKSFKEKLEQINLPISSVNQAIEKGARLILQRSQFRVPAAFGNVDLLIRGGQDRIERRINYLTSIIVDLIDKSKPSKIITIDKSVGERFLQLNGGLGSAVGNVLVEDNNTNLLKFNVDGPSLGNLAGILLSKLKNRSNNLHEYRFDVKDGMLPKLSFDSGSDVWVKDFLNRLVFYTDQADEKNVEEILKKEIEDEQSLLTTHNFRIKSEAIFLNYHDKIQKWWMSTTDGSYFTKTCDVYQNAVDNIVNNPIMNIATMMYTYKIKTIDCTFSNKATEPLKPRDNSPRTLIITNRPILTVVKVIQHLTIQKYVILDLHYILKLLTNEFIALTSELKTSTEFIIITVCENSQNVKGMYKRLEKIFEAVGERYVIIITDKECLETIKQHWQKFNNEILDERHSLTDLSKESQKNILKNTRVIFQGQEISMNLLIDDVSVGLVEGVIFNEVMLNNTIAIGESLSNPHYDDTKDIHVDRKVIDSYAHSRRDGQHKGNVLRTLHDIDKPVVLITAKPGMGKSTLLTHLSLKTKEIDKSLWIVRVNLLDYSQQFNSWQSQSTVIDALETLKFLCKVTLKNKLKKRNNIHLVKTNGEVCLQDFTGDEWATFELKLFLHYYNRRKLMFLFDGFDEICPYYAEEVITFLNVVKAYPQQHRMWITSRSYGSVERILANNFGAPYEIGHFDFSEQNIFLNKFWRNRLIISELNDDQIKNIEDFKAFILKVDRALTATQFLTLNKSLRFPLISVYSNFVEYVQTEGSEYLGKAVRFLNDAVTLAACLNTLLANKEFVENMLDFVGTPLHLYLLAEYLLSEIKDAGKNKNNWDLDISAYTMYEKFLETKLKTIRFQDKNKMDVCNPDIMVTYEKERADFIAMHKTLAAYAIFHRSHLNIFNKNQLKEIKEMIRNIRKGCEKSGVICNVTNDIPQFIHLTFAEYFAVEYISDLLKIETDNEKKTDLWNLILFSKFFNFPSNNIGHIMDQKIKIDPVLARAVADQVQF